MGFAETAITRRRPPATGVFGEVVKLTPSAPRHGPVGAAAAVVVAALELADALAVAAAAGAVVGAALAVVVAFADASAGAEPCPLHAATAVATTSVIARLRIPSRPDPVTVRRANFSSSSPTRGGARGLPELDAIAPVTHDRKP